jgi:hypothetical protein
MVQIEMEFKMLHSFLELLTHLHFYTLNSLSMINEFVLPPQIKM